MRIGLSTFHRKASRRSAKTLPVGDRQALVLAVAAQKGGVGKTTTCVTLGAAWARHYGLRVLVVDLDPQGHVNLALREQVEIGGGALSDVLLEQKGREVGDIVAQTTIDGLHVTPSDPELMTVEDRLASRIGKELALKKALEHTRTHYDVVLLDCPPNIGTLTVNALVAADAVLIPCNPTALSVAGVEGLLAAVEDVADDLNEELEIAGVAVTKVDGRTRKMNETVLALVDDAFGDLVLPQEVGVCAALAAAQLEGRDIYAHDPSSRGAEQYRTLAGQILERLQRPVRQHA